MRRPPAAARAARSARSGPRPDPLAPLRILSIGALVSSGLAGGYLGSRPEDAHAAVTACSGVVGDIVSDDSFVAALAAASAGTCTFIDIGANIAFGGSGLLDDTLTLTADSTLVIGSAVDDSTVTLTGNGAPGLLIETTASYDLTLTVRDIEFTDFDDSQSNHAALTVVSGGDLTATLDTVAFTDNVSRWNNVAGNIQTAGFEAYAQASAMVDVQGASLFSGNSTGPFGVSAIRVGSAGGDSHLYLYGDGVVDDSGVVITGNSADSATVDADYLNMYDVRVTDHSSPGETLYVTRYLYVSHSYFARNSGGVSGGGQGGAFHARSGGRISHSTFKDNYSGDLGGAIEASGGHLTVVDCLFVGNEALDRGGAINALSAEVRDSTFIDNLAGDHGGAVRVTSWTQISESLFRGNEAVGYGGAVRADDSVSVVDSTLEGNSAVGIAGYGGAISAGYALIAGSTLKANSASEGGGAIYAYGDVAATGTSFIGNAADGGGVFYSFGAVTLLNSTTHANVAAGRGIGYARDGATLQYVTAVDDSSTGPVLFTLYSPPTIQGSVLSPSSPVACNQAADDSSIASFATDPSCGSGDDTLAVVSRSDLDFGTPLTSGDAPGSQVLVPGWRSVLADAAPNRLGLSVDQLGRARSAPTTSGSVIGSSAPPPPQPAQAPRGLVVVAGDHSVSASWEPPASSGSFPVTQYQVVASPSGRSCLTVSLACTVSGLPDGVTQSVRVRALTGAGWGAWSDSQDGTPFAPSVRISGAREGAEVQLTGRSTVPGEARVRVWMWTRAWGEFRRVKPQARVDADGVFEWRKRLAKPVTVRFYATVGGVRSNRIVLTG